MIPSKNPTPAIPNSTSRTYWWLNQPSRTQYERQVVEKNHVSIHLTQPNWIKIGVDLNFLSKKKMASRFVHHFVFVCIIHVYKFSKSRALQAFRAVRAGTLERTQTTKPLAISTGGEWLRLDPKFHTTGIVSTIFFSKDDGKKTPHKKKWTAGGYQNTETRIFQDFFVRKPSCSVRFHVSFLGL